MTDLADAPPTAAAPPVPAPVVPTDDPPPTVARPSGDGPSADAHDHADHHAVVDVDAGLIRSLVVGGAVGFLVVYAISFGLFAAFGGYGLGVAAGVSVFVGLFGGIGFGAMVGASIR